jgi:hypothetical protein
MVAKLGWPPKLRLSRRAAVTEQIVNEHGAMRNETVIPDRDQIANERVGLNPAPFTDGCSLLDFNERPNERIIAYVAAVKVCWLDNGYVCTELYVNEPYDTSRYWIHFVKWSRVTSPFSGRARAQG